VREARSKYVGVEDDAALDALDDGRYVASVEERSERFEELSRAAEALKRLKPQEVTALVLKAQGLSYQEIAERQSWTYTKVNRCITEGRRAFLQRYAGIQSGEECERWLPVLSAMADGEASAEQLLDARPHLRNCSACRAVLGDLHRAHAPVAALLPPALLGGATLAPAGGWLDRLGELVLGAQERMTAPLVKAQTAVEAASSMKMAAVAASTVAIAGGGVAVERQAAGGDARAAEPAAAAAETAPSAEVGEQRGPVATQPLRPPAPARAARAEEPAPREPRAAPTRERRDERPGAEFAAESAGAPAPEPAAETPPAPATPEPEPPTPSGATDEFGFGG
jgi:hypothetical protein